MVNRYGDIMSIICRHFVFMLLGLELADDFKLLVICSW